MQAITATEGPMNDLRGIIYGIERFSLHDGPGIRTLVITKGCPLSCRWCSSPYTQSPKPEVLYRQSDCTGCAACAAVCKNRAITFDKASASVKTDRTLCSGCGECVAACAQAARELAGRYYTPEALLREVEKDEAFYRRSGGGVTVGGGEPTLQAAFVAGFLDLCRENHFHTAMETCAFAPWERFAPLLEKLDLVYIDLKHMDDKTHRAWTGASNRRILDNLQRAARQNDVIVRIPVIPGFNDSVDNISESAKFVKSLGNHVARLELLPYHLFGIHRYAELERGYALSSIPPLSDEQMANLRDRARTAGIAVEIGG